MSKILNAVIGISATLTILDIVVSLATHREPFIFQSAYDIFLIIVAGVASTVLLLRNIVFLKWDQIFPDLGLFFQAVLAFVTRFPENFVDFVISFFQLPFVSFGFLLSLFNISSVFKQTIGVPTILEGYLYFDLVMVRTEFSVTLLGSSFLAYCNLFDPSILEGQFSIGVVIQTLGGPYPFSFSLRDWLIDPIVNALKLGMEEMDLEGIVQQIIERF